MTRHYEIKNPQEYSKTHSVALKKVIEEGRFFGREHRENLIKARRSRPQITFSEKHRANMSRAFKASFNTLEQKSKRSERTKLLWQNPDYRVKVIKGMSTGQLVKWQDIDYRNEMVRNLMKGNNIKPNKLERSLQSILDNYYPLLWKYVGDGSVIIGGKNPDFINMNGAKQVIELFGNYWHTIRAKETMLERISHYNEYGFQCLIIWEDELKNTNTLVEKIGGYYAT